MIAEALAADGFTGLRGAARLALLVLGALFFLAGTVGMLRFPDAPSRLHAVTKADNVGLGLVVAGLALGTNALEAAKLVLVWLLVLVAGTTIGQTIASLCVEERRV